MRRIAKFLHTLGAIGFMGAVLALLVLLSFGPAPHEIAEYTAVRSAMGEVAKWVFLPSLALVLLSGFLAIALTHAYQNAGWAWVKLATGVLIFEWGLVSVQGPMQSEALLGVQVLAGESDPALLGTRLAAEQMSLIIMLAIATFNVVFGIWRPRLVRLDPAPNPSARAGLANLAQHHTSPDKEEQQSVKM